jgi:hypothetical protein
MSDLAIAFAVIFYFLLVIVFGISVKRFVEFIKRGNDE